MSKKTAVLLYDKTLYHEDAAVVERILRSRYTVRHVDIREPHVTADIAIHIRIPVYSAVSWAHKNVLLVHPDQWCSAFDAYAHAFEIYHMTENPWCSWIGPLEVVDTVKRGFVCIVNSVKKYNYVMKVLPYWKNEDPSLMIYSGAEWVTGLQGVSSGNVTIVESELTPEMVERYSKLYLGHLICSEAEVLDYQILHAEAVGAFVIANALPYYKSVVTHGAWISNEYDAATTSTLRDELDAAFAAFAQVTTLAEPLLYKMVCKKMSSLFSVNTQKILGTPILQIADCPSISIVTPTYNRRHLIDIAFHNILSTDYPHDKIEWIIVEDSEQKDKMATDKFVTFQVNTPSIAVKYIPIEGRLTIGAKRNLGVQHASHDIILFMDDDDHYPVTSFRRRVAWLQAGLQTDIVCCTTLPLYDLKRGTSAVSIPPFSIPLSQRISEATLTFRRSAWIERPFPEVSIAEGEAWIDGREKKVVEIPPQQIIVAFSHGTNQSSRIIPMGATVSCFWGFPTEYLQFIHGLAGVQVE